MSRFELPNWENPPKRVVSLVPSITESLFVLGFGGSVVGVTDYCTEPKAELGNLVRVGGPQTPNLDMIQSLAPDLVIAGQEETSRESIEAIADSGIQVWLIFPKSVDESMDLLRQIVGLFHTDKPAPQLAGLQVGIDYARASAESLPQVKVFVPIWAGSDEGIDWWMTFNQDTYMSDLLSLFGGENVFAGRERVYPLAADLGVGEAEPAEDRDVRYPRVTAGEIIAAQPELILLPDDPYLFGEKDLELIRYALKDTPAVKNRRVLRVDGKLLIWYGARLAQALRDLPGIIIPI